MIIPQSKTLEKVKLSKVLLFHFPSFGPLLETNKPLLAHFISFRGYRTDWVSTTLAVMAYGSKATVEENLRGRRCNRKDQNNSAGLTPGTIQFVMRNHEESATQWETSPETRHRSWCVNSQELVPQPATLWLFITCKLSNHKSVSTPVRIHGCTTETHKQEMMLGVLGWFRHWGSLECHALLGEQLLSDGSGVFSLLWWTVVAAENGCTMLIWRWRNKVNHHTRCAQAVQVSRWKIYTLVFLPLQ